MNITSIPATKDEIRTKIKQNLASIGSPIANMPDYSPFWRLADALLLTPLLSLRVALLNDVLPQLYLKTATSERLEDLAWGIGVERLPARKARGNLVFTGSDSGFTVPAGSLVTDISGHVRFFTLEDSAANPGETRLTALAECDTAGAFANLPENTLIVLGQNLPDVFGVGNGADWLTSPGSDTETDDNLRQRARAENQRKSGWHTDDVYKSIISDFTGVPYDHIFMDHTAPRGAGTANIYLLLPVGNVSQDTLDAVNGHIMTEGNHGVGDDVLCLSIPDRNLDVTLRHKGGDPVEVESLIRAVFRQNASYPEAQRVSPFQELSWSALAGVFHKTFPDLLSVRFLDTATGLPMDDLTPGMECPRLNNLTMETG